jgi:hypothetical protein
MFVSAVAAAVAAAVPPSPAITFRLSLSEELRLFG